MVRGKVVGTSCGVRTKRTNILYRSVSSAVLAVALGFVLTPSFASAQSYQFNSVRVEGNQRIQSDTIVSYAALERGKPVSAGQLNDAYQRILDSGVFETVELVPSGNSLIIKVTEFPTINQINFEGNRRIKDEKLAELIESAPRRVFRAAQAERDAETIAAAYGAQGRLASRVTPRIIRRSDNRVDLVFEIAEGDTIEVERVSFVGNKVYSDRRLRRVLETKQAGLLRTFINKDTLIEDRLQFDRQVLRDFYLSRGYVDFRVNSTNAEVTRERDAVYLVVDVTEGQQFEFGNISVTSEIAEADADLYRSALKVKPGVTYSPLIVERSIEMLETLATRQGIDFLRVEPRVTRNDRDLTLDVEFAMVRGPRVFVERIDIEGNTTTLDRVIRQKFRSVEGDPFNPREIRDAAERIRALGFFAKSDVDVREGSSESQVIVDVNVEEQPTGSLSLGGAYSVNDGFGVNVGLTENNFLGRGQRLSFSIATAQESEEYVLGFTEPHLLGRDLKFDLDLGVSETDSSYAEYDTSRAFFRPALTFNVTEDTTLEVRYTWADSEMIRRDDVSFVGGTYPVAGPVIRSEINQGSKTSSSLGFTYSYDSRLTGLDPNIGFTMQVGADYAGLGGDSEYLRTTAKLVAQRKILNEEVTLRATLETGSLHWMGDDYSRSIDRFVLTPSVMRGFEPGGIGPRDTAPRADGGSYDDFLGGNVYAVARFDAEFPLGLPEELGLRGGLFYDVGNLWGLQDVDTPASGGFVVGRNGSFRHVVGFSVLWTTAFGPLRFNFSNAVKKEDFDKEQSFDLTLQARF
ncbi:outer membrane protein assembly factor BamA [Phaeobacter gallaeciensis]|uniref:outer membrane protein assembly factor BamA n=1 Tax=Phaeobacter gallaeciensis TaxID=60890 RepID=UPI00237F24F9|nr:outer membrane protein assembly factor BamA [Phaeobacter gallaeciensis]MDE4302762.1 outer membrane protein assembly factor BamA [Phaeobacter gallaeciensis]MDE4307144.1 outer membrane protein assembly factor BamA [Phaeobacter gallaeciensis]MDE4311609.1 outer membrane protein assembly factor BamA [Phaeobacter gallaeciensis]MDE4316084.1 outer membrane protein assembly factor BamA [Phaeobacter gallaeciensis]MDE4320536.1 outer membrane protein assembly factor BamA [Phaeobacter gallaeciensis]